MNVSDIFDRAGINTRCVIKKFIPTAKFSHEEEMKNRIIEYIEKTHFGSEKYLIDDDVVVEMLEFLEKHKITRKRPGKRSDIKTQDINDRDTALHAMCCLQGCINIHFCKPKCSMWNSFNEQLAKAQELDLRNLINL